MASGIRSVVVVGNGIAGLTAADALRTHGFDGRLTIVGDEPHAAYSRPALSKALLRADGEFGAHELPPPTHDAVERLGVAAVALRPDVRRVMLSDGDELEYDGLVIASGSRARRLGDGDDELVVRTLDDAVALRTRIAGRPDVVIVGAGPLGMEVASGALDSGCRVTVISKGTPMARSLGEHLGRRLADAALARGIRLLETSDAGITVRGGRSHVVLADGTAVTGDVVVSAVGDLPNTEWLAGSGLAASGALPVDSRGRLRPGIVAAGDVAAFPGESGVARSPLWNSAIAQAGTAAAALLRGDDAPPLALRPYFWTEQFGHTVRVVGRTPLVGAPELLDGDDDSALLRWTHRDGSATAVAVNYRIPIPRLRALTDPARV